MTYLLMGSALLGMVYVLGRLFVTANTATLTQAFKWVAIILGGVLALLLILRGQVLLAGIPAALSAWGWKALRGAPLFYQLWRAWRRNRPGAGPYGGSSRAGYGYGYGGTGSTGNAGTASGSSAVDTDYLSMRLDLSTGAMTGHVRKGRFQGAELDSLSLTDQCALLAELRSADEQGASILEAYLDRIHGPDWRRQDRGQEQQAGAGEGSGSSTGRRGGMSHDEALHVLGLESGAGPDDIKEAHRRLMLANHPDRGGSDYLAAKINEAKDVLLGRR
ncbi:MAG: molecular chaperone DnaJ [Rhodospirillaceae bacterium]|mgnify:CR=1 FL=1|nr:molecular chaperone DnaJ [Rhodospirillaceae bacterium]